MPAQKKSHPLLRFLKIVLGLALLVLGVVGLFLPVLQGILFMLVGLALLGTESRRVRKLLQEMKRRYPGPWERAEALKSRMSGWVKAVRGRTE